MLPTNVGTGLVVGQFGLGVIDSPDIDREPEAVPLSGRIIFTPSVVYFPNVTADPNPITIMAGPIVGVLDESGYLCTPDTETGLPAYRGVRLFATNDPDMSVENWTWSVVYQFDSINGFAPKLPAHAMALLEGEEIDLTKVVPVPSSPGIGTPQALALLAAAEAAAGTVADARVLMERAEDAADRAEAPTDQMMASTASNPSSQFSGVLDGVIESKTPDAIQQLMGPVVDGLVSQSIASDPTVANAAAAAVDANPTIHDQGERLTAVEEVTPRKDRAEELWSAILVEDKTGNVALGVKSTGEVHASIPALTQFPETVAATEANTQRVTSLEASTAQQKRTDEEWAAILVEDKAGKVALGVRPDGSLAGSFAESSTGYDIIVLGGQSDMSGSAKPYGTDVFPPHPRVLQYPATRWGAESGVIQPAIEPLLGQGPLTTAKGGGPGLMFGRLWAEAHPDRIVLLVPAAATASGFNTSAKPTPDPGMAFSVGCWQLNKVDEPVNLGRGMVDQAVAAKASALAGAGSSKTVNVVAFLWSQGLSDTALSTAQYSTYFDELVQGLRTELDTPDLPVVVGQMSPQGIEKSLSGWKIDQAHMDTPRRLERSAFAYSFKNLTNSPTDDHLSPRGQHKYAQAMFEAHVRACLNVTEVEPVGVEDLTARKVGGEVRVKWTAPASRVTGYVVEYAVDGGTFTSAEVTRYHDMDTAAVLPWSGSTMEVRVTTSNEAGASSPVSIEI